ncbi:MAG: hypothetical protein LBL58_08110 [Tannerellaceae bacterium]|nr:hypothetical protein [Tannerellaceae bacterium]
MLSTSLLSCSHSDTGDQATLPDFQKRRLIALKTLEKTPDDQIQPIRLEVRTTAEQRSGVRRIRMRFIIRFIIVRLTVMKKSLLYAMP